MCPHAAAEVHALDAVAQAGHGAEVACICRHAGGLFSFILWCCGNNEYLAYRLTWSWVSQESFSSAPQVVMFKKRATFTGLCRCDLGPIDRIVERTFKSSMAKTYMSTVTYRSRSSLFESWLLKELDVNPRCCSARMVTAGLSSRLEIILSQFYQIIHVSNTTSLSA